MHSNINVIYTLLKRAFRHGSSFIRLAVVDSQIGEISRKVEVMAAQGH